MPDISFGPFRLLVAQRLLVEGDKPVRLGTRALDILVALTEQPGELVSKSELMARVWPGAFVEETNLTVNVAALRRALGDGQAGARYIVNIPGRGYRFVAPIAIADEPASPAPPVAQARPHNLPARLTRLVGRTDFVADLICLMPLHRLLTIVGPGGVGKTSVALDAAEQLIAAYEHGVWLIDLAPIADPGLVPTALASALGLEIRSDNPLPGLIAAIGDRRMLLVLDNCEHVIEAAAALAVSVLAGARGVHILATSREPLRIRGERLRRLPPLECPPISVKLSAAEALRSPAVQLFVERAAASMNEFELSDVDAPVAADICGKLDGIPLAIELAAARVETHRVGGLAQQLDHRFRLLTGGRRTALPRHRTLAAALDWSYRLLRPQEQTVFRRLAIFAGGFTLDAARAVTSDKEPDFADFADIVESLVMKSLVAADTGDGDVRFRLFETMRAYAFEKLREAGERERFGRRHAEFFRDSMERAEAEWETRPSAEWLAAHAREIDNVRAALDWSFSPGGDAEIGVDLAVASVALWSQLTLLEECRTRVEQALSCVEDGSPHAGRGRMKLLAALGYSVLATKGPVPGNVTAWSRALEIADSLADAEYQLRALNGLFLCHMALGEYRTALVLAERFYGVAEDIGDSASLANGDRIMGYVLHFLGQQTDARRRIESMLDRSALAARPSYTMRYLVVSTSAARSYLAQILWLQGFPNQAVRAAEASAAEARLRAHALTLCIVLREQCAIELEAGDWAAAERCIEALVEASTRHNLPFWSAWGRCFKGALLSAKGVHGAALELLQTVRDELRESGFRYRYPSALGLLAKAQGAAGQTSEGLATIEQAVALSERSEEFWCIAELLRIKGELLIADNAANHITAEEHFTRSLDWARQQGALSWELRTATSLGRLWHAQSRVQDAHELLNSVYARFTEGFETADLRSARQLLEEWATAVE